MLLNRTQYASFSFEVLYYIINTRGFKAILNMDNTISYYIPTQAIHVIFRCFLSTI